MQREPHSSYTYKNEPMLKVALLSNYSENHGQRPMRCTVCGERHVSIKGSPRAILKSAEGENGTRDLLI